MSETYDFIIVGGGTSGSTLARRLADAPFKPKVLLLEGGGTNSDPSLRTPDLKWALWMTEPSVNWGYTSVPQQQLNGQILPCSRGRGLGGSSCINFSNWVIGHSKDYDRIAELTGDECWKWDGVNGVKERFKRIERLHVDTAENYRNFLDVRKLDEHSKEGMVDLAYDPTWPEFLTPIFEASKEWGMAINEDLNSGNPSGWGITPATYHQGSRVTASTAYLSFPPSNLTILTESPVAKIIFNDSKKAIGVQTHSGTHFSASKEVILSAGAIDSPRLLLLSGIGPSTDLSNLSIPTISNLPSVGKNLQDHPLFTLTLLLKHSSIPETAPNPSTTTGTSVTTAWLSPPTLLTSPEFTSLPPSLQTHLKTIPLIELGGNNLPFSIPPPFPDAQVLTFFTAIQSAQSRGTISLSSSNPSSPPLIDLNYSSHPYDRRAAIEGMRTLMDL